MCIRDRASIAAASQCGNTVALEATVTHSSEISPPPFMAVSYTHLDVYKRQGMKCNGYKVISSLKALPHMVPGGFLSDLRLSLIHI